MLEKPSFSLAGFSDADQGETQLLEVLNLQANDDQGQPAGTFTPNANGTSWSFSPNPNFNGNVTLSYAVSDGTAETPATNSFALASVNDIPELTGVKATLDNGTEDLTYTISAADLLAGYTDADITNDAGSTQALSILGLSATGGFIADNGDGTYSFSPNPDVNGVITLNYVISDGAGGNTLATNSFSLDAVNDLPIRTAGNVSTLFLLEDQAIASMGLGGLSYSVGGGTDETDAQTLTYSVDGLPEADIGTVFLADGETALTAGEELTLEQLQGLKFLAAPNASGQAEFSFQVSDGVGSITETIALDILNFNDTPVLPADAITLADGSEDTAYTFSAADLLAGVTDVDVDANGVADVDNLEVINLSVTNGQLSYDPDTTTYTFEPDANFNGIARFNYSITDNNGGTVSNTVELNIVAVNDAPTATFDVDQTIAENSNALTGLLTATDVDGNDGNTFTLVSAAIDGADPVAEVSGLTIAADGKWNFDPKDPAYNALAEGESQVITITYQASDDAGASSQNSFSIIVTGTNDAPIATFAEAQATTEDAPEPITGQLTATDVDNNTTLSYALVGAPIDGLSITADGAWSFDPSHPAYQGLTEGQNLDINVTYSVTDNNLASAQNTFVISLTGTNDGPQLSGLPSALPGGSEDNPYTITKAQLLAGFSDADQGETQLLEVLNLQANDDQGQPAGTFTPNANGTSWSFSPNPNFNGNVTLSYAVSDGTAETPATNSFALASVNDIPELTGVKATLDNGTEDLTYTISAADLLAGYTDADITNDAGSTQALSILGLSATGGFIADNGDGTYSFSPNPDVNGVITLNYVISDGAGGNTLATNSFSLDAVNDLPIRTAGNVSTLFLLEDQAIASMGLGGLSYSVGGGTDETDAQTLTYSVDGLPEADIGTVFLADGETALTAGEELTLEQLQGLKFLAAPNASGQAEFSFQVSDGVGSITETIALDILNFNDTPVLPADAITLADGSEDTAYTFFDDGLSTQQRERIAIGSLNAACIPPAE